MASRNKNDVRKRLNMAEKNQKKSQKQTNSQGVHPLTIKRQKKPFSRLFKDGSVNVAHF